MKKVLSISGLTTFMVMVYAAIAGAAEAVAPAVAAAAPAAPAIAA